MIAIIDYGIGNVGSIFNMLKKIGCIASIANNFDEIELASKYILPGVGSFDTGMRKFNESGLKDLLLEQVIVKKKPILGICLGMQMMGYNSEEGIESGLSLLPFRSVKFNFQDHSSLLKLPHMGWNYTISTNECELTKSLENTQRYYFVHSYHAKCEDDSLSVMKCNYGYDFVCAVAQDNIYGVQFHPEKSHRYGMNLLKQFSDKI